MATKIMKHVQDWYNNLFNQELTEEGKINYFAKELYRQMKGYTPREWSTGTKVLAGSLIAALGAGAGCATTRMYDIVETLPDEVDVLNIDSRPQAEVIYNGKPIGKTPMQVTATFKRMKRTELEETERGGRIIGERERGAYTYSRPEYHKIELYAPGYLVGDFIHCSDGESNSSNYFRILPENGNKPLFYQEQKVIIKQEGKLDKIEIK